MTRSTNRPALAAMLALAALGAVATGPAAAAEKAGDPADAIFQAVAAYKFGQDQKPLIAAAELIRRAHGDAARSAAMEDRLIKLLDAGTPEARRFACRQLWMVASPRSVPAVAKLLGDAELSDAARYALERLDEAAAGAALRAAAGTAKGAVLIGLVNTLGLRRDAEATGLLVGLLGGEDPAVAAAAAGALGHIGSPAAAKALTAARAKAGGALGRTLDDACIRCAEGLLAGGHADAAAAIYQPICAADQPRRLRIAALRGLMLARPAQAGSLALAAMKSEDPQLSGAAAALLRELPGEAITAALGRELPHLPPDGQVLMLDVLARRGGSAARPAVRAAADSKETNIRVAAIEALGTVGSAEDVPRLSESACAGPPDQQAAARASLARLSGAGVEAALVKQMRAAAPRAKAVLLGVLAGRYASGAVRDVLAAAKDTDAAVRAAAFAALGPLAGEKELPELVDLLVKAGTEADRAAAGKALAAVLPRAKDKPSAAEVLLVALDGAPAAARAGLVRLLPLLPSTKTRAAVRAAMKADDVEVRDAAVRALADWPSADVLGELLDLAANAKSETHKILAVRGAVRVLGMPADRPPAMTAALYGRVMKLAARPDEKRLVLAGLADVGCGESMDLIEPLLDAPGLKAEAQTAAVQVARAIAGADRDRAVRVLKKIASGPATARLKAEADATLSRLNRYRQYVLSWMLAGPFVQKGKDGPGLFDVAFAPEKPGAPGVTWRAVTANKDMALDLAKLLGGENRTAYLRATLVAPAERAAVLKLGSDDGIKAWLNGKLVHANNASRSLTPDQDSVKVTLRKGDNVLLLKINNGGTDWGASARVVGADGKAIDGLKVVAR